MKKLGIVRRIDDLGRIVIPKELRRTLKINEGDPLEIFVDNGFICLKLYQEIDCDFCGSTKNLVEKNNKYICPQCIEDLRREVLNNEN